MVFFHRALLFVLAFYLTVIASAATFNNTVYIITNAETPSLNLPGLTPVGQQRAEVCLPALFAPLDVGLVITCPLNKKSGLCAETITTATPIANALGANMTTKCGDGGSTSDDCVIDLMKDFAKNSTQSILVVWDLSGLDDLFEVINVDDGDDKDEPEDSDDETPHYDILWTIVKSKVKSVTSQNCTGIDGQAPDTFKQSIRKPIVNITSRITGGRVRS